MRSILAVSILATAAFLSACASQEKAPEKPAAAPAPAPAAAAPAAPKLQCWNGDVGAFQEVGTKATIAGVAVECKPTADGKAAQWMGVKK
ncbi:MAG: hypothetical protein N3C63_11555 [Rhodocyclaceae bacterium]|nr:hypothetical protein [Rhodocyclaceae bacterium]